jgi:hypothetical protein
LDFLLMIFLIHGCPVTKLMKCLGRFEMMIISIDLDVIKPNPTLVL